MPFLGGSRQHTPGSSHTVRDQPSAVGSSPGEMNALRPKNEFFITVTCRNWTGPWFITGAGIVIVTSRKPVGPRKGMNIWPLSSPLKDQPVRPPHFTVNLLLVNLVLIGESEENQVVTVITF